MEMKEWGACLAYENLPNSGKLSREKFCGSLRNDHFCVMLKPVIGGYCMPFVKFLNIFFLEGFSLYSVVLIL